MQPKPLDPQSTLPGRGRGDRQHQGDAQRDGDSDPVVAPPFHGGWHALLDRVDPAPAIEGWPHELNLDPRFRAAAGLGARVIRQNQDDYMKLAWSQVGEVLAANRQDPLAAGTRRRRASSIRQERRGAARKRAPSCSPRRCMPRVLGSPQTIRRLVEDSRLPARSALRPDPQAAAPARPARAACAAEDRRADGLSRVIVGLNDGNALGRSAAPAGRRPDAGAGRRGAVADPLAASG